MYIVEKLEKFKEIFDSKFIKLKHKAFHIERNLLFKYQILTRGFADDELWSLDITIAEFILPRLKAFKDITYNYPIVMKTKDDWGKKIDMMIEAFEILSDESKQYPDNEDQQKIRKGLNCFTKYFKGLWY